MFSKNVRAVGQPGIRHVKVNGEISDGVFYDPYKRFSIKIPPIPVTGFIDGHFDAGGGEISFVDYISDTRLFVYTATNEPAVSNLKSNPPKYWARAKDRFEQHAVTTGDHFDVLHSEQTAIGGHPCLFSSYSFPQSKKQPGSVMYSMTFTVDSTTYILAKSDMLYLIPKNRLHSITNFGPAELARETGHLESTVKGMQFRQPLSE